MQLLNARIHKVVDHRRLFTRPLVKGFKAPLPREAGKVVLFCGFRRSCFFDSFLSLLDLFFGAALAAPSTSMSIKSLLAFDSHPTSAVEAGQRRT